MTKSVHSITVDESDMGKRQIVWVETFDAKVSCYVSEAIMMLDIYGFGGELRVSVPKRMKGKVKVHYF